jgi:hypothetical protein
MAVKADISNNNFETEISRFDDYADANNSYHGFNIRLSKYGWGPTNSITLRKYDNEKEIFIFFEKHLLTDSMKESIKLTSLRLFNVSKFQIFDNSRYESLQL